MEKAGPKGRRDQRVMSLSRYYSASLDTNPVLPMPAEPAATLGLDPRQCSFHSLFRMSLDTWKPGSKENSSTLCIKSPPGTVEI